MVSDRASVLPVFILVLWSLSACATFREGTFHPPASWPIATVPGKQSISLLISGEAFVNGQRISVPQQAMHQKAMLFWRERIAKAYRDSGLFSDVQIGAADTDLRAEIHVLSREQFSEGLIFLGVCTLTVFPTSGQHEFIITTTLKDRELQSVGTFEKAERETEWTQLFLIFIMPFHWPKSVTGDLVYDLNRSIISQAYEAGVLQ